VGHFSLCPELKEMEGQLCGPVHAMHAGHLPEDGRSHPLEMLLSDGQCLAR